MSATPIQFTIKDLDTLQKAGSFVSIQAKTYTLPALHLVILQQKLPQTEHSCHSCGVSFFHQMPGQGSPEQPVVLPCGHIGGSRCMERRLDTPNPTCFVCDRAFPLRPKDIWGAHGPADAASGFPVSNVRLDHAGPQNLPQMAFVAQQAANRGTVRVSPFPGVTSSGLSADGFASQEPSPFKESSSAAAGGTRVTSAQKSVRGGYSARDIEAAKTLVEMSKGSNGTVVDGNLPQQNLLAAKPPASHKSKQM